MDEKILAALIGIFGLVIGALLQSYLTRRSDAGKHSRELRAKAYTDLVNSIARLAVASKAGESRQLEVLNNLSDAKTRITIYGDEDVIRGSGVKSLFVASRRSLFPKYLPLLYVCYQHRAALVMR